MTTVKFDQSFFDNMMRSAGVDSMCQEIARDVMATAKMSAPADTGDYRDGIIMRRRRSGYRNTWVVEGTDWKTMIIEARTGNLARALKSAGR